MKVYVPSGVSQVVQEAPSSGQAPDLHPSMRIEVPEGWEVTFSSQESQLLLRPLEGAPVSV